MSDSHGQPASNPGASPAPVKLTDLPIGSRAKVVTFNVPPEIRGRLAEMGLTTGVVVEVVRYAPLGDPVDIRVRGYHLSLRKCDASGISVSPV